MKPEQILDLERKMLEEHRKDVEALQRLKRFMPANGYAPAGDKRQLPLVPNDANDVDEEEGGSATTIRGTIESIMNSDVRRKWTVQTMLAHLLSINFPFKAKKPINSVSLSLQALYKKQRIVVVRKGAGSEPSIYRGRGTEGPINEMGHQEVAH
jgi:hypothetical protein